MERIEINVITGKQVTIPLTEEEILDEFRDFIDSIRPEDFQG